MEEGDDLRSLDWLTSYSLPPDLSPASSIGSSAERLSPSSPLPTKDRIVHSRKRTSCSNRLSQCTIGCWIYKAILHSEQKALALCDIYDYVQNEHPDHDMLSREWKRSVRHSLSTSQCFSRVSAPESTTRSSHQNPAWWTIHPDYMRTYKSTVTAQGPHHRCPPKNGELSKWSRVKRHASSEYELAQMAQDLSAAAVIFNM
uniref:Fork-head domain-containing protein n=1 Tax=Plectus sambesii TaxID=2011161 RepID=A0A914WVL7_9BILA